MHPSFKKHSLKSISSGAKYNMVSCTEKLDEEKSKHAGLAHEIGCVAQHNSKSLLWLVKGTTTLCTRTKECNKLDLTGAQRFSSAQKSVINWT